MKEKNKHCFFGKDFLVTPTFALCVVGDHGGVLGAEAVKLEAVRGNCLRGGGRG